MKKLFPILGLTVGDDVTTGVEVSEVGQKTIGSNDIQLSLLWRITKALELMARDKREMNDAYDRVYQRHKFIIGGYKGQIKKLQNELHK